MTELPTPDYLLTRPRDEMDDYYLAKYPHAIWIPVAIYIWFVKIYGPKWMEHKKPYKLTQILKLYNVAQVLVNGYILCKAFIISPEIMRDYMDHHCHYINSEEIPTFQEMANLCYLLLYSKLFDFVDSIFIVLKKNNRQLSFLHVFHHASVAVMANYSITYREGFVAALALLNTFIHVIMYSYYFAASFKSLKGAVSILKPTITKLQIIQFLVMLVYLASGWFRGCSIGYKMNLLVNTIVIIFLVLFINFYVKNYKAKTKSK